ncbi:MAG: hypothetical protein ACOC5G_00490 [Acidobacteriota bacterium]
MRPKTFILLATAVLTGLFFFMNLRDLESQEKNTDENNSGRLVRMDLLKSKNEEMKSPLRNIFTAEKTRGAPGLVSSEATGGAGSFESLDTKAGEEEGQSKEINQEKFLAYNLKYLGYIASLEKKVALILYNGEALAVEKGAILLEGIEIIDISLDNVTVKSSESEEIVIKLEGEEK